VFGRVGVINSRLSQRTDEAWAQQEPPLRRITLHECRHTYASYLMAAGYTLREIMEYLGHSSLAATERYVKLLPQPEERKPGRPAQRLCGARRPTLRLVRTGARCAG
jgi:integrase